MARERVLLVDDEKDFTEILAERLRNRDMDVDTADSGVKAIEMVDNKYYDAIILDLAMPGIDGLETLRRILSENPDQQVVFLTGYASVPKSVEAIKHGAVEFLEKPANINQLVQMVRDAQLKKAELFEKRMEESIDHLKKNKGW
ncbi:MAG: response regulator [FCB group bacterium]|nr:response regulator [FCB group bacterium]